MPVRKYRRESSEVSCCLKYLIFSFNYLFWVSGRETLQVQIPLHRVPFQMFGLCVFAVGIWAWTEKDTFNNLTTINNLALDPAFVLICVGCITFLIGLTGCVGALRENTASLAAYSFFLLFLLIGEMCLGVLVVVLKDKGWIKEQATDGLRAFITHYREDPDQQNLIDWIQEDWLQCCGVEGPKDWDSNNYFNCSSTAVGSREACGVPFSCCKRRPQEIIKNKQCGYDVRKEENVRNYGERDCLSFYYLTDCCDCDIV